MPVVTRSLAVRLLSGVPASLVCVISVLSCYVNLCYLYPMSIGRDGDNLTLPGDVCRIVSH